MRTASAIVAGTGAVTLVAGYFLLHSRLEMIRKWKPVEAQVIRNWIEERQSDESTSYSAHYELAYMVDGKPVRSTARSEDTFLEKPELVRTRLDRHGAGTRGVVYTNPDDPSQVRLNLGRNGKTLGVALWVLLAGASQVAIGLSLWLMGTPAVYW